MASESTAVSLPGRTQHPAEHSPPSSPARAPGDKRDLGYAPLKSRRHPSSWVSWSGTIHTRAQARWNYQLWQAATCQDKRLCWNRQDCIVEEGGELKTYCGSGRTGQWAAVPWHKRDPHRSCCAGFSGRRQHGTRRRSPVCR